MFLAFWITKNRVVVFGDKFFYRLRKVKLSIIDVQLLKLFLSKFNVSNQEILMIFDDPGLDLGTITRRKNDHIYNLNEKLKFLIGSRQPIIFVEKSNSDRRNTHYRIDRSRFIIFHS